MLTDLSNFVADGHIWSDGELVEVGGWEDGVVVVGV